MNRIAVISMVKNEADIIESFVRHTLSFADVMLVAEHQSTDDTRKILENLQAEGLPLRVEEIAVVEQVQSEVLTRLMKQAAAQEQADIILPLDADEFLISDRAEDCRQMLQRLDSGRVFSLDWVRYLLAEPEVGQEAFLLARPCIRERMPDALKKAMVGSRVLEQAEISLTQGNHAVVYRGKQGIMAIEMQPAAGMHLAHFPWRGQEQAASKEACGWLTNVAKYSVYTNMANHWHKSFQRLQRGGQLQPIPLQEPVKGRPWTGPVPQMRYTVPGGAGLLHNLLCLGERLAEAYREESILRRQCLVSVLLPFWGDLVALERSLESVCRQTYPYKEVFVLLLGPGDMSALQALLSKTTDRVRLLDGRAEPGNFFASLGRQVSGEYIQWVFPGDVLEAKKLQVMLAALETQENITFVLSQAMRETDADCGRVSKTWPVLQLELGDEGFVLGDGDALWQTMLQSGELLPGGLSAALFRRSAMEHCQWFSAGLSGGRPMLFSLWGSVLPAGTIGVLREKLVSEAAETALAETWAWRQIEWACLLQSYAQQPEFFSAEQYRRTLAVFHERGQVLQHWRRQIPGDLWWQYEKIAETMGRRI